MTLRELMTIVQMVFKKLPTAPIEKFKQKSFLVFKHSWSTFRG
jgi:hypothetical protein